MIGTAEARGTATRCAVIGSPIAHSMSPALHSAAYRYLGLENWEYGRFDVAEAELRGFLDGLDATWRGLSLTMPLKTVAIDCVDEVSQTVERTSAINTILLAAGHRTGDNTDVSGMVEALRERGAARVSAAAVLGGGATARSSLVALAEYADSVTVYVRATARIAALRGTADALGLQLTIADWGDRRRGLAEPLLVSTTPAGATDDLVAALPKRPGILLDVVYAPWPTALAGAWAAAGGPVAGGADLLVHQAARQVELMTGRSVPVEVLRLASETATQERVQPF